MDTVKQKAVELLKDNNFGWPMILISSLERKSPRSSLKWLISILDISVERSELEGAERLNPWLTKLKQLFNDDQVKSDSLVIASKQVFNIGPSRNVLATSFSRAFAAEYEYRLGNKKKYESLICLSLTHLHEEFAEDNGISSVVLDTFPEL